MNTKNVWNWKQLLCNSHNSKCFTLVCKGLGCMPTVGTPEVCCDRGVNFSLSGDTSASFTTIVLPYPPFPICQVRTAALTTQRCFTQLINWIKAPEHAFFFFNSSRNRKLGRVDLLAVCEIFYGCSGTCEMVCEHAGSNMSTGHRQRVPT